MAKNFQAYFQRFVNYRYSNAEKWCVIDDNYVWVKGYTELNFVKRDYHRGALI